MLPFFISNFQPGIIDLGANMSTDCLSVRIKEMFKYAISVYVFVCSAVKKITQVTHLPSDTFTICLPTGSLLL